MTYQRGTDLKHCPTACQHSLESVGVSRGGNRFSFHTVRCYASASDTCPREQAEMDEICATCGNFLCSDKDNCGYWKERTNG